MNTYDARQQLLEGLEQYIAGIETAEGLPRMARNVSGYHDKMPSDGCRAVQAILEVRFSGNYAAAGLALYERFSDQRSERAA
jgi:hypothetical protein